jgi:hypothetical protein
MGITPEELYAYLTGPLPDGDVLTLKQKIGSTTYILRKERGYFDWNYIKAPFKLREISLITVTSWLRSFDVVCLHARVGIPEDLLWE